MMANMLSRYWGSRGRRFKSCHPDWYMQQVRGRFGEIRSGFIPVWRPRCREQAQQQHTCSPSRGYRRSPGTRRDFSAGSPWRGVPAPVPSPSLTAAVRHTVGRQLSRTRQHSRTVTPHPVLTPVEPMMSRPSCLRHRETLTHQKHLQTLSETDTPPVGSIGSRPRTYGLAPEPSPTRRQTQRGS